MKREGASYFVTFRLADSLPKDVVMGFEHEKAERLRRLNEFLERGEIINDSVEEIALDLQRKIERYLDRGAGEDEARRADAVVRLIRAGQRNVVEIEEGSLRQWLSGHSVAAPELLAWNGRIGLLAALIGESDLYIGYDSAGQHIAAALGVSCIDVMAGFTQMMSLAMFEKYPSMKCTVLESGANWISAWLDRMDHKYIPMRSRSTLKMKPSEYFYRQCVVSADPDETMTAQVVEHIGADYFVWASDYPHIDSSFGVAKEIRERIEPLPIEAQRKVLGGNAIRFYNLPVGQ